MTARNVPGERFPGHRFPQVIPDLAEVAPGAPAPWSTLPIERRSNLTLARVRAVFERAAQRLDDGEPPEPTELTVVADGPPVAVTARSAVLVALFEEGGEVQVILTRRATNLRFHAGEVALPGGRSETDETAVATALRESFEEVGLVPGDVQPFAWLNPLATFASSSAVWPIVGLLRERPALRANPDEVEQVFSVSLRELLAEGAFLEERWRRPTARPGADADGFFPIYFFKVPHDVVWGATARILFELLALVAGA